MTILLPVPPSKKNSRRWIHRGGRSYLIPSERYQAWENTVYLVLCKIKPIEEVGEVCLRYWMPNNIKKDLTNASEGVMDALVKHRIIKDDCWQIVPKITMTCLGINRENPRVEVEIK